MTRHRAIWECKQCEKHCTIRTEERIERPPRCPYWRDSCVFLRKDGMNKEKLLKDWPRVCICGGEFVKIFCARRGEDPKEYVECKVCKSVIE